jgi:hypothetical protein
MTNLLKKTNQNLEDIEYEKLLSKVYELNQIQQNLIDCIQKQDTSIDNIESNLDITLNNVEDGNKDIKVAESYYFKYKPIIIGSLIGAVVAGPIGVAANIKLGSLITLGGTFAGGAIGYKIQKI